MFPMTLSSCFKPRTVARAVGLALLLAGAGAAATDAGTAEAHGRPHDKAPAWCGDRCDQVVLDWSAVAYQVIKAADGYQDPMAASRALAMMHLALHDAANAVKPLYETYATSERDEAADPAIAAVTAAHDVLANLYPSQRALLQATLDQSLVEAGVGEDVVRGTALGRRVAADVLARRAGDHSDGREMYVEGIAPGEYRFTPGFDFIAAPHWRSVRPFALAAPDQFRSAAPPALNGPAYARAFNEVKGAGVRGGADRAPDESAYAAFWYEFSDIGWNRIARVVARRHRQDLWERARLFASLNAVMADAYIAGWDSKMHYNFWRPVTAVRLAESDGNPATAPDASWAPFLVTPPIQDYPSTHSALGAAAATVLAYDFGRERAHFRVASTTADPASPTRAFKSFGEAALENADSRVKAGLHFRFSTDAGLKMGWNIGALAVDQFLKPLP